MDFNISAQFSNALQEPFWILSDSPPCPVLAERFELAYVEVRSMFMSNNPFLLTRATGRKPQAGQLVPDVFFCDPNRFQFGDYTLTNSVFWDRCLDGKGFLDALVAIGQLIGTEQMGTQLKQWEQNLSLHCFNLFTNHEHISAQISEI